MVRGKWRIDIMDKAGVLLLNSALTVEQGNPNSHQGIGWEDLTQRLLGAVIAAHVDDP